MARLGRSFFEDDSPKVARALLGKVLVREVAGRRLSGVIVEAEAYRGGSDPASHAFRGKTERNSVMFDGPGRAYVYFTMGMHYCLNLTTEPAGTPGAVLIRAVEPREGLEVMMKARKVDKAEDVASGPGKLTKAMRIDGDLNGEDVVTSTRLFVEDGPQPISIGTSSRVGISAGVDRMWRFFVEGNRFVSRAKPSAKHRTHN